MIGDRSASRSSSYPGKPGSDASLANRLLVMIVARWGQAHIEAVQGKLAPCHFYIVAVQVKLATYDFHIAAAKHRPAIFNGGWRNFGFAIP
jgi:hypothetical protein